MGFACSRRGASRACALLLVFGVAGCDSLISAPEVEEVALPPLEQLIPLIQAVDDVHARVLPALEDETAAGPLASALQRAFTALNGAEAVAAAAALADALTALEAYASSSSARADGPELTAIEIVLLRAESLLDRPCRRISTTAPAASSQVQSCS